VREIGAMSGLNRPPRPNQFPDDVPSSPFGPIGEIKAARDLSEGMRRGLSRGAWRILLAIVLVMVVFLGVGVLVSTLR
jgi:hypothetical protein